MNAKLLVAIGTALIVGAPCARAQNLVVNGNFDTDLSGWTTAPPSSGTPVWFNEDCCGTANSGSARLQAVVLQMTLQSTCIAVSSSASYDYVVHVNTLPVPPDAIVDASAFLLWSDAADCSGAVTTQVMALGHAQGWRQVGATFVSPATAHSAYLQLNAGASGLSTAVDAYFDDIRFGPAGTVPVTLQSFDVE